MQNQEASVLKKLFFVIMILLLALPCSALSESTDKANDITGVWYLELLQADEYDFKPVLLTEGDMALSSLQILTFNEDGSGTIADMFNVAECTWSEKGSGYELVINGQAYDVRLENSRLYLHGMADPSCPVRSMKYTFVFSRQLSYAVVPPVQGAVSQEELSGTYTGTYLLQGGKVRELTENVGIELDDGRITISLEDEIIELNTAFNGEEITVQLSDAEGSYAAWLLAGYTDIRIRPCEKRSGIIAADAVGESGELGFRLYFIDDELNKPVREVSQAAETSVTALDTAFEADALKLVKVEQPAPTIDDVVLEIPDGSFERIGENTQEIRERLGRISDASEMLIGSIAPGGKSGFAILNRNYFAFYDGKYRLIHPSPDKGADDVYRNLASLLLRIRGIIPYEGIVYSPDGCLAVIPNVETAIAQRKYSIDPALIDLRTGEIRLIETFSNNLFDENSGTMIAARFGRDSETLYYTVFSMSAVELYRYSIQEEQTELILRTPEYLYNSQFGTYWEFSGLALTPDGNFALISDNSPNSGNPQQLVLLKTKDEIVFTVEPHNIPDFREQGAVLKTFSSSPESDNALLYFRNDAARSARWAKTIDGETMQSGKILNLPDLLIVARPDKDLEGLDNLWAIQAESLQAVQMTEDDIRNYPQEDDSKLDLNSLCRIMEVEQSPDGRYALLLVSYQSEYKLLMLRLSDMCLRLVEGIDASEIRVESAAKDFPPVIDWNADTLTIFTMDALEQYRFE